MQSSSQVPTPVRRLPFPVSSTQLCAARTCLPRGGSTACFFEQTHEVHRVATDFRILRLDNRRDRVASFHPAWRNPRDRLVAEQERAEHTPAVLHTHTCNSSRSSTSNTSRFLMIGSDSSGASNVFSCES